MKCFGFRLELSRLLVPLLFVLVTGIEYVTASSTPCIVKGRKYTRLPWYGYLVQKTFHRDMAKINYQITYPLKECCPNLLIYYDDQIRELKEGMSCYEREKMLPADNNQIINLKPDNRTIGCKIWNETGSPQVVCIGERTFRSSGPRTWYFAVSNCGGKGSLDISYFFNITGFYGECETDPLAEKKIIVYKDNIAVVVVLAVIGGFAVMVAISFFVLWFMARRRKSPNGSVTSSQATMTQDIYYVNPGLSDRGDQTDYSHSSTGSGASSENYYEVIPERRSYDTVSTQNSHNVGSSHRHNTHQKEERRPFRSSYVFEDYPPPPYHPPQLQKSNHRVDTSAC